MSFLKRLWAKDIFKVSFWSGVSTLIKLITGFILGKVLAISVGPAGVAMIGQLTNFTAIFNTLSTGATHTGVTKFVAEYHSNEKERLEIIKASFFITVVGSLFCSFILIMGARYFNGLLFRDLDFTYIVYVYALTIFFYGINTTFLSIINGLKEFKLFIKLNSVISISGLIISLFLIAISSLSGALLAVVLSQTISCVISFLVVRKRSWFRLEHFINVPNESSVKKLLRFASMTILAAFVLPLSQIYVRSLLIERHSLTEAGLWDGITRISGLLQLFVVTSLTTYYIPRLSEISGVVELKLEVSKVVKLVLPLLVLTTACVYLLRNFIVLTLYTKEFLPITSFFIIQLLGDVFKLTSWLYGAVTLARANVKYFLLLEGGFCFYYMVLSYVLIPGRGLEGAVVAYLVSYIINFILSVALFLRYCRKENRD